MPNRNAPVIESLLNELQREADKIARAHQRMIEVREELSGFGVFPPDVKGEPTDPELQCPSCYATMDEIRECKKCGHTERR